MTIWEGEPKLVETRPQCFVVLLVQVLSSVL